MTRIRKYSELRRLKTFEERFEYLQLFGEVGEKTFGFDRYINQQFYRSTEWRRARRDIIARDLGCDLGMEGYELHDKIIIHHMNPMRLADLVDFDPKVLDPEFLISTSHETHNAVHYGDKSLLRKPYEPRRPGDTKLW